MRRHLADAGPAKPVMRWRNDGGFWPAPMRRAIARIEHPGEPTRGMV